MEAIRAATSFTRQEKLEGISGMVTLTDYQVVSTEADSHEASARLTSKVVSHGLINLCVFDAMTAMPSNLGWLLPGRSRNQPELGDQQMNLNEIQLFSLIHFVPFN